MYRNIVLRSNLFSNYCYNILIRNISINVADMKDSQDHDKISQTELLEENISVKEPISQFKLWFEEVCEAKQVIIPHAMALATATKNGAPSVRMMILKSYGKEGFAFCTHYDSRKGKEIDENPQAALTFFWDVHARSVRIEGSIMKLNILYSEDCFKKTVKPNQIVAFSSKQSTVIAGRQILEKKQKELAEKYKDCEVPLPQLWGGYIVVPHMIEFWQGHHLTDKIHDRIRFRRPKPHDEIDNVSLHKGEDGWVYERLSP